MDENALQAELERLRLQVAALQAAQAHLNKAERALRESEDNFRTFFETMDDMVIVGTPEGRIMYTNPAVSAKLGYSTEELGEMHILDLHPCAKREEAENIFGEMFAGERDTCPLPVETKSGKTIPVETRVWFGKWSGLNCVFGICKDLSKEQEALQKFDRLFRNNPALMAVTTIPQRRFTDVNNSFLRALGYSREEVIGRTSAELGLFVQPELQQAVAATLEELGSVSGVELKVKRKDETVLDGLFSGEMIESQGQKSFLTVMVDVTERRKAEKALHEKEACLRAILNNAPFMMWLKDRSGRFLAVNEVFAEACGVGAADAILGKTDLDVWPRELAEAYRTDDEQVMTSKIRRHVEEPISDRGKMRWFETYKTPIVDPEGFVTGTTGFARDITDRKLREEEIRCQKEFLDAVIDSLTHPFYVINVDDHRIETANAAARSIGIVAGAKCYSAIRHRTAPCTGTDHACAMEEARNTGRPVTLEQVHSDENGPRNIEVHCFPLPDPSGRVQRVIEYTLDVTDRKNAVDALLQTEKYRAVADLTAGVAHNFNNLLQIVIGNASLGLLKLQSRDVTSVKDNLAQIMESSRLGAATVRRLINYARTGSTNRAPELKVLDLSELVLQAVAMSTPLWKNELEHGENKVRIRTPVTNGCTVLGDSADLFEVVLNLIKNAVEALPNGGDISVGTEVEGQLAVLRVTDTGLGIAQENVNRLFTPFFTTSVEAGRGLGLATCRRTIEAHRGNIVVETVEGRGTTFRVSLPLAEEQRVMTGEAGQRPHSRQLKILVVDDIEATTEILRNVLVRFGHSVTTALSGEEAMEAFDNHPWDLILCDLGMPGMSGWDVGKAIRSICEERGTRKPAFALLTGWVGEELEKEKIAESGTDAVIPKPVDPDQLAALIQTVTGGHAGVRGSNT